jgi:hypothetical protein
MNQASKKQEIWITVRKESRIKISALRKKVQGTLRPPGMWVHGVCERGKVGMSAEA